MVVVDTLGNVDEVAPADEVRTTDVAVALATRACERDSPAVVHEPRRDIERGLEEAIVTYASVDATALLGIGALGHHVDGTTDGGEP